MVNRKCYNSAVTRPVFVINMCKILKSAVKTGVTGIYHVITKIVRYRKYGIV